MRASTWSARIAALLLLVVGATEGKSAVAELREADGARARKALAASDGLRARLRSIPEEYVLVQVWSPFCAPCGAEAGELNAALKTANARAKRLAVLGIPVQSRRREIDAFLAHFRPAYAQWHPDPAFRGLARGGIPLPWTFLLDKGRAVIQEWVGRVGAADVLARIPGTLPD